VARLLRIVVERAAQLADDGLQHRFADVPMAPHRVEQRVLAHELAGRARERAQHVEGFWGERDRLAVATETRVGLVEVEAVEAQRERIGLRHATDPRPRARNPGPAYAKKNRGARAPRSGVLVIGLGDAFLWVFLAEREAAAAAVGIHAPAISAAGAAVADALARRGAGGARLAAPRAAGELVQIEVEVRARRNGQRRRVSAGAAGEAAARRCVVIRAAGERAGVRRVTRCARSAAATAAGRVAAGEAHAGERAVAVEHHVVGAGLRGRDGARLGIAVDVRS